jgi:cytochrome c biogenesis protein CcmG/thiol:disulfide interchange protein DsbE
MRLFAGGGAATLAVAVLGVLGWGLAHPALPAGARTGAAAPNVTVELLDGSSLTLDAYRGSPVVVNFWATWCADCRREAAALSDAARSHPDVRFLGLLYQDTAGAAREYQATGAAYPYPVGYSDVAGKAFAVEGNPETYFLDRQGVVRAIAIGPVTAAALERDLQAAAA